MAAQTAAQEEFNDLIAKASSSGPTTQHKDDTDDYKYDAENSDREEEDEYLAQRLEEDMRISNLDPRGGPMHLPPRAFDDGRTTGVKGVIADARSYEEARRKDGTWKGRFSRAISGNREDKRVSVSKGFLGKSSGGSEDGSSDAEEEEFIERWREQRRAELQKGSDIRSRRTSPSVRRYGRFDEVDALGYLDAIEKVTRETTVVVFVYDDECAVSQIISDALIPLVSANPYVHFVRVHYADIEFDNAGVPAILAYKNQGDLFANLTYIIDQIPDETLFDTKALEDVLRKHSVL